MCSPLMLWCGILLNFHYYVVECWLIYLYGTSWTEFLPFDVFLLLLLYEMWHKIDSIKELPRLIKNKHYPEIRYYKSRSNYPFKRRINTVHSPVIQKWHHNKHTVQKHMRDRGWYFTLGDSQLTPQTRQMSHCYQGRHKGTSVQNASRSLSPE